MSSTDLSTPPLLPTATKKLSSKSSRPSKRIILRLSPHLLAKYPSAQPVRKASRSKPPASVQPEIPASSDVHLDVAEDKVELQPTHAPEVLAETTLRDATPNPLKRKGVPGPKPGAMKRVLPSLDANGLPKPRGKPGPKKRIKLDGEINNLTTGTAAAAIHKLGPKANQGAINAGLRALDRTGKAARKWQRKGFQLKSFTGVTWQSPSWRAPNGRKFGAEGEEKGASTGSSDDLKPSSIASEKSNGGGDMKAPSAAYDGKSLSVFSPAADTLQPS